MTVSPTELWPWLALAALGLFHGINPAMGWLFAVALGLNRGNRRIVLLSLAPIALGHAAAVAAVLAGALTLGLMLDHAVLMRASGVILLGWAAWHALYGHRQRLHVGMRTGLAGLVLWSFLMATAHGAGLMLIPILLPICNSASTATIEPAGAIPLALAAVAVHSLAMLATIAAISVLVYEWAGVGFLRRGWVNLDWIWVAALILCGAILLAA
jgi:hypothetical protein